MVITYARDGSHWKPPFALKQQANLATIEFEEVQGSIRGVHWAAVRNGDNGVLY
jgi:hypothetical protein